MMCGTPVSPAQSTPAGIVERWAGHSAPVRSLAISRDGSRLLSGSEDGTVRLWDTAAGKEVLRLAIGGTQVTSVRFSPDQDRAVVGYGDNRIRIFDLTRGACTATLSGHTSYVSGVAWSPDGRTIWSVSWDKTVRAWDSTVGIELHRLEGHGNYVDCVAISPDGRWIASGSMDETVRVWEANTGRPAAVLKSKDSYGSHFHSLAFSPDGRLLVATSLAAEAIVWDLASMQIARQFEGHVGNVFAVAWSKDGRRIVTAAGTDFFDEELRREFGTDNTCRVWDLGTGQEIQRYTGHSGNVNAVVLSPDGSTAFSAGREGMVHQWAVNR